jgi:putative transposase
MVREHRLPIARAFRAAKLSRAAYYRQGVDWVRRDAPVIDALNELVGKHRRWGFWKCTDRLCNQGREWNPKRTYRVYCKLGLNLKRERRRDYRCGYASRSGRRLGFEAKPPAHLVLLHWR